MAIIKNPITVVGGGGGDIVNSIISEFNASSGTINANTFVEFVNTITATTPTAITSSIDTSDPGISGVQLDSTHVFLAYKGKSSNYYLFGRVCTFTESTVTAGTETTLSTTANTGFGIQVELLSSDKVVIKHRGLSGSYAAMAAIVCTISGTTVTAGTDTIIQANSVSSGTSVYFSSQVIAVSTSKFLACAPTTVNASTARGLSGYVCNVSNGTITVGTKKTISSTANDYAHYALASLDDGRVMVVTQYNSDSTVYGYPKATYLTISSSSFTVGNSVVIYDNYHFTGGVDSILPLGDDHFLLFIRKTFTGSYMPFGIVFSVDTEAITSGAPVMLRDFELSNANNINCIFACKIDSETVYVVGSRDTALVGMSIKIADYSIISPGGALVLTTLQGNQRKFVVPVSTTKALMFGNMSGLKYSYATFTEIGVREPQGCIDGVTKTSCTASTKGEVYVFAK